MPKTPKVKAEGCSTGSRAVRILQRPAGTRAPGKERLEKHHCFTRFQNSSPSGKERLEKHHCFSCFQNSSPSGYWELQCHESHIQALNRVFVPSRQTTEALELFSAFVFPVVHMEKCKQPDDPGLQCICNIDKREPERPILLLSGERGCGKSTLVAQWLHEFCQQNSKIPVIPHFCGIGRASKDVRSMLRRCTAELRKVFYDELPEWVEGLEERVEARPLHGEHSIISKLLQVKELRWLPAALPSHCKLILTTTTTDLTYKNLVRRSEVQVVTWPGPSDPCIQPNILRHHLALPCKDLPALLLQGIMGKKLSHLPVVLAILVSELRTCGMQREEEEEGELMVEYLEVDSVPELWVKVIRRWVKDYGRPSVDPDPVPKGPGPNTVASMQVSSFPPLELRGWGWDTLCLIHFSRSGLSEAEILALLGYLGHSGPCWVQALEWSRLPLRPTEAPRAWERKLEELPWHLQRTGAFQELHRVLTHPAAMGFLSSSWRQYPQLRLDVVGYWTLLSQRGYDPVSSLQRLHVLNALDSAVLCSSVPPMVDSKDMSIAKVETHTGCGLPSFGIVGKLALFSSHVLLSLGKSKEAENILLLAETAIQQAEQPDGAGGRALREVRHAQAELQLHLHQLQKAEAYCSKGPEMARLLPAAVPDRAEDVSCRTPSVCAKQRLGSRTRRLSCPSPCSGGSPPHCTRLLEVDDTADKLYHEHNKLVEPESNSSTSEKSELQSRDTEADPGTVKVASRTSEVMETGLCEQDGDQHSGSLHGKSELRSRDAEADPGTVKVASRTSEVMETGLCEQDGDQHSGSLHGKSELRSRDAEADPGTVKVASRTSEVMETGLCEQDGDQHSGSLHGKSELRSRDAEADPGTVKVASRTSEVMETGLCEQDGDQHSGSLHGKSELRSRDAEADPGTVKVASRTSEVMETGLCEQDGDQHSGSLHGKSELRSRDAEADPGTVKVASRTSEVMEMGLCEQDGDQHSGSLHGKSELRSRDAEADPGTVKVASWTSEVMETGLCEQDGDQHSGSLHGTVHQEAVIPLCGDGGSLALLSMQYRDDSSDDPSDSDSDSSSSSTSSSSSSSLSGPTNEPDQDGDQEDGHTSGKKLPPVRTQDELLIEDLPPVENLTITLPEETEVEAVGIISSIIDQLVIVESKKDSPPLNEDSVLFNKDHLAIGRVFEVFGPVCQPYYVLRFNSQEEIEQKNLHLREMVFFAPKLRDFTDYIFVEKIKQTRGSDASWKNDQEPPPEALDFSDDEQERLAKQKLKEQKRHHQQSLEDSDSESEPSSVAQQRPPSSQKPLRRKPRQGRNFPRDQSAYHNPHAGFHSNYHTIPHFLPHGPAHFPPDCMFPPPGPYQPPFQGPGYSPYPRPPPPPMGMVPWPPGPYPDPMFH
ncbi:hypothetical protein P4O66_014288, partial [Electrophorus voltai]